VGGAIREKTMEGKKNTGKGGETAKAPMVTEGEKVLVAKVPGK